MSIQTLYERLRLGLQQALLQKDKPKAETLKVVISRIDNATAVPVIITKSTHNQQIAGASIGLGSTEVLRREVTETGMRQIIQAEIDELDEAIKTLGRQTSQEYIDNLRNKMEILEQYLH